MNNKSIITIILAVLLAMICAFFVVKKDKLAVKDSFFNEEKEQAQEVVLDEINQEDAGDIDIDVDKVGILEKPSVKATPVLKTVNVENAIKSADKQHEVNNKIQELSIVEEAPDYGIIKDENGNIIITRAFSPKSRYKYSFRDFGVIDKVSSK